MKKRVSGFTSCKNVDETGRTFTEILAYVPDGLFIGRIYMIHTRKNKHLQDLINSVYMADYVAKLPGAQIYVSLSDYAGMADMYRDYDLQNVVDSMLDYLCRSYLNDHPGPIENSSDSHLKSPRRPTRTC